MKSKVYVPFKTFGDESEALEILQEKCEVDVSSTEQRPTKERLMEIADEYDGMIVGVRENIDHDVVKDSRVNFIGLLGSKGKINREVCKGAGIEVFDTKGVNAISVAEHTFALLLGLAKDILNMDESVRNEEFDRLRGSSIDLEGKTLGIIGAGNIAEEVIQIAKAFNLEVVCWTFHPSKHEDMDVNFIEFEELLENSDFVSVHIKASEKTEDLIDKKEFKMMKSSSYLINTSRGRIVNEDALVDALKDEEIKGAGLDVYEEEPTHNQDLFKLNNVILTPHTAGISRDGKVRMREKLARDIVNYVEEVE